MKKNTLLALVAKYGVPTDELDVSSIVGVSVNKIT